MNSYDLLINKLDQFIRKYYLNQLIRGALYTTAFIVAAFIAFNLLEYHFYFDTGVRKLLFFGFIGGALGALGYWVVIPLLKYFRLGSVIDHEQAASIIGDHFTDVKDKLLNILQLKRQSNNAVSKELITASINQKTESIRLIPFRSAIDLGKNKKYLKYALPPALLLLVLIFAAPSLITEPTHRIINNDKQFEREAPFHFMMSQEVYEAIQYEDVTIRTTIEGEALPHEVFIDVDNFQYRMKKEADDIFSYTFKNVQKSTNFRFFSGVVKSMDYELEVLLKPNLADMELSLDYPNYIGRRDEKLSNVGDVIIPEGTVITWNFEAEHTDQIDLTFESEGTVRTAERQSNNRYRFHKKIRKNDFYKIYVSNEEIPNPDSLGYSLNVTPDQYPEINVETFSDSIESSIFYFIGRASDDYGLTSLTFNYTVTDVKGQETVESKLLQIPEGRDMPYDYTFDIEKLELEPGESVSYYFEVKDNDGVNGAKAARTATMQFEKPTVEEFEKQEDDNEEDIKEKLKEALKESKKIQEQLQKLREKMLQKNEPTWEDKKELEKLLERQKQLEKELKEAKEKFEENLKNQEEFSDRKEEVLEKQEKLEELFEEVVNDEMQELMDKIQELMEELNKDQMLENMEQMKLSDEEQEKQMDRLLELFKNLEVEKEAQDLAEKLEELAEKQEELAEETEKEEKSKEELDKEQEELNKEMEELEKKMQELEEKNEELERPKDLGDDNQEQMDDIQQDMEESQEDIQKEQNKSASQKQKNAAQKMKKMSQQMQSSMQSGEMEQMQEDIQALRQLLENLVTLSFDQEDLMNDIRRTQLNTPKYVSHIQEQFKLKDDFQLIEDSLQALARRNDKIEGFVSEKVVEVKKNISSSLENLEERKKPDAQSNQRHTIKNVNDLALMLSESMEQMQQQMSGMMQGNQMCNKPGGMGGKSSDVPMDKITKGQKELNGQLEKMSKDGKGGQGKQGSAKDFAKAAAQQAALRRALEEMQQKNLEQGKGSKELQEIIDGMDKVETDLVNKRLDTKLLQRQQEILTRLLEAEKADRQREKDNKRKATTGEDKKKELPPALQEYLKEKQAETEMYKKVSPALRPFYKNLVDEYYKALKSQ